MLKSGVVVGNAFACLAAGNHCVLVSECFYQYLKKGKPASPYVHRSMGSRDGVVTIALAGWSGFDLGLIATSGLSWLLVLYSAPRGLPTGSPVSPSLQKSTFLNSSSIECRTSLKTSLR